MDGDVHSFAHLTVKNRLFIAATIGVSMQAAAFAQTVTTGSSDPYMNGTTPRMFIINAATPGALTFSGTGTATFNNAVGTNNQFNVGSNTNLGVNASVSATKEFDAASKAVLTLDSGSNLMQSNGTAGTAAASVAVMEQATSTAKSVANSSQWGTSYDSSRTYNGQTNIGATEWKRGWESEYKTAYETAASTFKSSNNSTESTGIISGSFVTRENSNSKLSQSSSIADVVKVASDYASSEVSKEFGSSYTYDSSTSTKSAPSWWRNVSGTSWDTAKTSSSAVMEEYTKAKSAYSDQMFAKGAQAAAASVASVSDSQVTVKGLGAIASVNASSASNFTVDLDRLTSITQVESTATANGSATSNLGTSSFATQSNQRTASAFMQAFAGTGPSGASNITGIKLTGTNGDASSSVQVTESITATKTSTYGWNSTSSSYSNPVGSPTISQ